MTNMVSAQESREVYAKRKQQVLDVLKRARECFGENGEEEQAQIMDKLSLDLENGEFSIVVVGEFSAGKSTLLNALMKEKILPSFMNETTATVNFLRHKEKAAEGEAGRVFYRDGTNQRLETVSLKTVQEFGTTKGDQVEKKVEHLDLYLDSAFLEDGVTLVDSPGLNGVADGHRKITEDQILKSHASIFLFNCDHPGSKTDFEFLYELQSKVKTIIFVLNKIDMINGTPEEKEKELEEVIQTLKNTYKKRFPDAAVPEIWPVAAYPALVARSEEPLEYHDKTGRTEEEKNILEQESGLQKFEDRLFSFLTCGEKAKQQLLSPVERVLVLMQESREQYEQEEEVLNGKVDAGELEQAIAKVKETIKGLEEKNRSSKRKIEQEIHEAHKDISEELKAEIEKNQNRMIGQIEDIDELDELQEYAKDFIHKFLTKISRIADEQDDNLREYVQQISCLSYQKYYDAIKDKLKQEDRKFNLQVSVPFNIGEVIVKAGIRERNEKLEALEAEKRRLEEEIEKAEEAQNMAQNAKKRKEELQEKRNELEEKIERIETMFLPPVEYHEVIKNVKKDRGMIGNWVGKFFGDQYVQKRETVKDSSERDKVEKNNQKKQEKLEKEIENIQKEIKEIPNIDLWQQEKKLQKENAQKNQIVEEMIALNKEQKEEVEKKYKEALKKLRKQLKEGCDELVAELWSQVKKELRNSEQDYVQMISDIVADTLKEELEEKKKELERLEEERKASEEEKEQKLEKLKEKIEKINAVLAETSDLKVELSAIPEDQIQRG